MSCSVKVTRTTAVRDAATPPRAAVYLRISQDPTGEQAGVERQREDTLQLVQHQGGQIHDIYVDNDLSATSDTPRPAYRRLLDDIRAGHIDAVVAWHPDRLYRRLADLEELIDAVDENNILMRTVRAGEIDLSTPTGRMVARIIGATAQAEGEIKADRWKRRWRQDREQGAWARTGTRLFGYTRDGQLIDTEARVARQVAADVIAGTPILTIARGLERQGIKTTRSSPWTPAGIKRYLTNPVIAGYSTLNGHIITEGTWTPILDRDTWETTQAVLGSRTRAYAPRVSLLNGILHCGKCGHRMITSASRGRRTYRCPNRPTMPGCGSVSGYAEPVEAIVEAHARKRLANPKVRTALARRATTTAPDILAQITGLEARIRELEKQLDEPGMPVATILRAIGRAKDSLDAAQRRLAAATPVHLPETDTEWPVELERRRRLVEIALDGRKVRLHPATARARVFDPTRVTIDPT